jgi:hypothetical protein
MHAAKSMVIYDTYFLLLQYGTLKRSADPTAEAPCVWCSGRAGLWDVHSHVRTHRRRCDNLGFLCLLFESTQTVRHQ